MFDIKGNYEFIKLIGFEEEYYKDDLYLYLPKQNVNVHLFQKLLSYIELLLLNFQENEEEEQNYYEKNNNLKKSVYSQDYFKKAEENYNINNNNNQNNNNVDIRQILKDTKDVRLGNNKNNNVGAGNNWNMRRPSDQGAKILKETGQQRYQNALKYGNNFNRNNVKNNNINNNFKPNIHSIGDYNNSLSNNNNISNQQKIKSSCGDEIGKKCLELTNVFRARHKLPPLIWDDAMWKISLTHSKNMGNNKVPFGHKGFDDRLRQFPFSYNLACENVFMCTGYSDSSIARMGVDGWINSPGHRKNLLSNTTHCAIASYRTSSGSYYLTQMFARKS